MHVPSGLLVEVGSLYRLGPSDSSFNESFVKFPFTSNVKSKVKRQFPALNVCILAAVRLIRPEFKTLAT